MRAEAVRNCLAVLQHFGISPQGRAIDVGGTREVYLKDGPNVQVTRNPLLDINPEIRFLDAGFNEEHMGTSSDDRIDLLDLNAISSLLGQFDLAFCFDTLEHVSQPFTFCNHLARLIKPEGAIYLSTIFSWVYHPSPEDYFRFSPVGLQSCFEAAEKAGACRILWTGWENDERGVGILVCGPEAKYKPDVEFLVRTAPGEPGMLPDIDAAPPTTEKSIWARIFGGSHGR